MSLIDKIKSSTPGYRRDIDHTIQQLNLFEKALNMATEEQVVYAVNLLRKELITPNGGQVLYESFIFEQFQQLPDDIVAMLVDGIINRRLGFGPVVVAAVLALLATGKVVI